MKYISSSVTLLNQILPLTYLLLLVLVWSLKINPPRPPFSCSCPKTFLSHTIITEKFLTIIRQHNITFDP